MVGCRERVFHCLPTTPRASLPWSSTNQESRLQEARTDPKVHPTASLVDPQAVCFDRLSSDQHHPGHPPYYSFRGCARVFVPITHCHRACVPSENLLVPFGRWLSPGHRVLLICRVNRNHRLVLRVNWTLLSVRESIVMQHSLPVDPKKNLVSLSDPSQGKFFRNILPY